MHAGACCCHRLLATSFAGMSSRGVGVGLCVSQRRAFNIHRWSAFKRWQELQQEEKEYKQEKDAVKNFIRLPTGLYITPERSSDVMPKKAPEDQTRKDTGAFPMDLMTFHTQMRYIDHSFDNTRRFKRYRHFQHLQFDQRFIPERLLFLGPDLAAAHFLVHRDAAVKFVGDDVWIKKDKKGRYDLPGRKVPGLFIEAIDASDTELMFEGFDNLCELEHLRMLRLAGCQYADDWMMGRIGTMFSRSLEMLDLSDCDRITAKGLTGLRSLKKLRYLRLEGMDHIKDIAKTALLLEQSIPNLKVLGLDYNLALESLKRETKLFENDRVLIDAKGNAYAEDDNGRLFYIAGRVNERPTVCDEDKPIMTSTVRREIPEMDDVEFERLDKLSGGKLRHLLVGSPSGYSWTEQVETILSFEEKWKSKQGIPVDPKMLPKSKRPPQLLEVEDSTKEQLLTDESRKQITSEDEECDKEEGKGAGRISAKVLSS
ncbi:ATP synthase subunit s-like protein [Toxocara canis]|uniref:ATP synthase subunit s-like protein n=1 Tax=Toxocara canis TaxID=6265 RepID=A0A0B2VB12_TOXCA|nr:ATP synthase subunit s-like protein [Toxocara canis]